MIGPATPRTRLAALALTGTLALTGCSGSGSSPAPGPVAAEPGSSPELTAQPVGTVVSAGGNQPEGVVVVDGTLVVAVRETSGLVFLDLAADGSGARVIEKLTTDQSSRHLDLATPAGPVLVPLEGTDELLTVDVPTRSVTTDAKDVGDGPHNAARTAGGTDVVTNEHGGGVVFVRGGEVVASLPAGPPQPGGLAVVGDYAAVADVQGGGVWVYDARTMTQVAQKPVGALLTHAITLAEPGRVDGTDASRAVVALADTSGGAVELERITPQVEDVGRIDAPGSPYGLAYDAARAVLYVTLTDTNLLRVVDLADPANPRVLGDLPTVRQPNSVTVDERSGTVVVAGSHDGNLQLIPRSLLPGG